MSAIPPRSSPVATRSHHEAPAETGPAASGDKVRGGTSLALLVGAGILLSRIAGLIRESIFAHYLGNSAAADAFKAGFRIPNILQNLFGEGVLSASFIPVYSRLLSEGEEEAADLLAWSVGAILGLAIAILVVAGVLFTPYLIDAIAPGFHGARRDLTIRIVRILFPGAGLLVMSAWCLGVLNSHHRFFASYTAPVAWNAAIIAALIFYGPRSTQDGLALKAAWGSVAGAALQIIVQLPQTLPLLGPLRIHFARVRTELRNVFNNLMPVIASRGVAQVSGYIDNLLASLLPVGAVAGLNYAQILYLLPVSLFGMSVAAAELPAMSRVTVATNTASAEALRARLNAGLRQISFMVVPSAAAFLIIGDVIVALLFQSGAFKHRDALYVWAILAGSAVGLLAATMSRLYNSTYYAMWDTRTPLRYALIRVGLTLVLGYLCAIILPPLFGIPMRWGVAGLSASAGVAAWVEFTLLRRSLNRRLGWTGLERRYLIQLWAMALAAGAIAFAVKHEVHRGPRLTALAVIPVYGAVYLGLAWWSGLPELSRITGFAVSRAKRIVR
ncbi:MAG TPA: murein biosynthesis integral membrane protein MurJ [Candidatus Binataceae bacterium]|nr:murein biosynthesis integral membrane protein MurJ [Candidatus Binataceae bacterium]